MARFGGPGHIWWHVDKYSGNAKERIRRTVDLEAALINGRDPYQAVKYHGI
jgi:hypothetical protein